MEFQVTVTGFKSEHDAKVFCDWYCGQGEQDADYWFEENGEKSSYHFESMNKTDIGYKMSLK